MKKTVFVVLISSLLTAFTPIGIVPVIDENVKELSGYRLRDTAISLNDFNLWVITQEVAFDDAFIADSHAAPKPKFDVEMVLAAKVVTQANTYNVRFRSFEIRKDELNVYFSVQRDRGGIKDNNNVTLASVPKNRKVKKVNFFHDNVRVRTVPIVSVY